MKNISAVILLACTLVSTSHALNFLQKLHITHSANRLTQSNVQSPLHKEDVAHFTNHWKGQCISDDGESTPLSLSIQNNAEKIKFDDDEAEIGALMTVSDATREHSYFSHFIFNWSDDGQQLMLDYTNVGWSHESRVFVTETGHLILSLETDKLVMKVSASNNNSDAGSVSMVCTLVQE